MTGPATPVSPKPACPPTSLALNPRRAKRNGLGSVDTGQTGRLPD